jgi:hypothetical protein
MSGNRTIIGSEADDTKHIDLDRAATNKKVTLPVSIYDANGNQINLASGIVPNAYDEQDMAYDGSGNLISVIYKLAGVTVATLTLTYSGSNLVKVIKS